MTYTVECVGCHGKWEIPDEIMDYAKKGPGLLWLSCPHCTKKYPAAEISRLQVSIGEKKHPPIPLRPLRYPIHVNSFEGGLLQSVIWGSGYTELQPVFDQLLALQKRLREEAGVKETDLGNGMVGLKDMDGTKVMRQRYPWEKDSTIRAPPVPSVSMDRVGSTGNEKVDQAIDTLFAGIRKATVKVMDPDAKREEFDKLLKEAIDRAAELHEDFHKAMAVSCAMMVWSYEATTRFDFTEEENEIFGRAMAQIAAQVAQGGYCLLGEAGRAKRMEETVGPTKCPKCAGSCTFTTESDTDGHYISTAKCGDCGHTWIHAAK